MNQKQRKAKLKRANHHRTMAKCPDYQSKWSERMDKWVDQMKEKGRLVDAAEPGPKRNWPAIAINSLIVFCILFVMCAMVFMG